MSIVKTIAGYCLAIFHIFGICGETSKMGSIAANKGLLSAEVVLAPRDKFYRSTLNETQLQHEGCHVRVTAPEQLSRLVSLLDRSQRTSAPASGLDRRYGIFLEYEDGRKIQAFFSENHGGNYVVHGLIDETSATAPPSFPADLRALAAEAALDLTDPRCKHLNADKP